MSLVFIYGSIRKGNFNHTRYGFDKNTKFLSNAKLNGAKMYSLGSYPCIVLTNNPDDIVYGEIYEYLDEETETKIRQMEIGAGYVEKEICIKGEKMKTFVYENPKQSAKLVKSGDWNKR